MQLSCFAVAAAMKFDKVCQLQRGPLSAYAWVSPAHLCCIMHLRMDSPLGIGWGGTDRLLPATCQLSVLSPDLPLTPPPPQITDLAGSSNFVVLAIVSLVLGANADPLGYTTRRIVATAIVVASRLELALFLFVRVLSRGKDARFDEMREKFWVSAASTAPGGEWEGMVGRHTRVPTC